MAWSGTAHAQAARVLDTKGTALVERSGQLPRLLGPGEQLGERDVINVARDSWAILEFSDQTRITLRPNTVFRLDSYRADAPETMLMGLVRGGMRVVTGLFSKRNPSGVKVQTAVATIGIRGTEFDARLCEADCAAEERARPAPRPLILPVARVVEMNGVVAAARAGEPGRVLVPGAALYEGDGVATGPAANAVLVFSDGARVTLNQNSRFAINRFQFSESSSKNGGAFLTLLAGNAQVWTGQLAKISPDAFLVRSAMGVIRPHGTGFSISGCIGSACGSVSGNVDSSGASGSASGSAGNTSASASGSAGSSGASGTASASAGGQTASASGSTGSGGGSVTTRSPGGSTTVGVGPQGGTFQSQGQFGSSTASVGPGGVSASGSGVVGDRNVSVGPGGASASVNVNTPVGSVGASGNVGVSGTTVSGGGAVTGTAGGRTATVGGSGSQSAPTTRVQANQDGVRVDYGNTTAQAGRGGASVNNTTTITGPAGTSVTVGGSAGVSNQGTVSAGGSVTGSAGGQSVTVGGAGSQSAPTTRVQANQDGVRVDYGNTTVQAGRGGVGASSNLNIAGPGGTSAGAGGSVGINNQGTVTAGGAVTGSAGGQTVTVGGTGSQSAPTTRVQANQDGVRVDYGNTTVQAGRGGVGASSNLNIAGPGGTSAGAGGSVGINNQGTVTVGGAVTGGVGGQTATVGGSTSVGVTARAQANQDGVSASLGNTTVQAGRGGVGASSNLNIAGPGGTSAGAGGSVGINNQGTVTAGGAMTGGAAGQRVSASASGSSSPPPLPGGGSVAPKPPTADQVVGAVKDAGQNAANTAQSTANAATEGAKNIVDAVVQGAQDVVTFVSRETQSRVSAGPLPFGNTPTGGSGPPAHTSGEGQTMWGPDIARVPTGGSYIPAPYPNVPENAPQIVKDAVNDAKTTISAGANQVSDAAVQQAVNALNAATAPILVEMTALMTQLRNNPPQTEAAYRRSEEAFGQLMQRLNAASDQVMSAYVSAVSGVVQSDAFQRSQALLDAAQLTFWGGLQVYTPYAVEETLDAGGISDVRIARNEEVAKRTLSNDAYSKRRELALRLLSSPDGVRRMEMIGISRSELTQIYDHGNTQIDGSSVMMDVVGNVVEAARSQGGSAWSAFFAEAQAGAIAAQQLAEQQAARATAETNRLAAEVVEKALNARSAAETIRGAGNTNAGELSTPEEVLIALILGGPREGLNTLTTSMKEGFKEGDRGRFLQEVLVALREGGPQAAWLILRDALSPELAKLSNRQFVLDVLTALLHGGPQAAFQVMLAGGGDGTNRQAGQYTSSETVAVLDGEIEVVGRGRVRKGEMLASAGSPVRMANFPDMPVVKVDPDLFRGTSKPVEEGLYVWVRDGAVQVAKDDKLVDVSAGNAAVATKDKITLLDVVPNFLRFDPTPRPAPSGGGLVIDTFRAGDGAIFNMCTIR